MSESIVPVEWRTVPDFPDYEISEYGTVRRLVPFKFLEIGRVVKSRIMRRFGYLIVTLRRDEKSYTLRVNRLVAAAFLPPRTSPNQTHVAHWDGVKTNNHYGNLRWATPTENGCDRIRHGTAKGMRGEASGNAVLTEKIVAQIRVEMAIGDLSYKELALRLGLHERTVHGAAIGETWAHIKTPAPVSRRRVRRAGND